MFKKNLKLIVSSLLLLTVFFVMGCGSDNTGDNSDTLPGDVFVSEGGSTGTVSLQVTQERLLINESSGFKFTVRGVNGIPVTDLRVTCSAEEGLTITEGSGQLTDENGVVSGQVVCTAPGSYRMGCRTPTSAIRQDSTTIICVER